MRNFYIFFTAFCMTFAACATDTDFSTEESDCQVVEIVSRGKSLTLEKDTAWYVKTSGGQKNYCDKHKVYTFFNTLRDIQLQGLSSYDENAAFDYVINIKKRGGKTIKILKFNAVPNSPQLIGSCNGGKCRIVAVPGLNESPASNFSSDENYWKELSLLEINAENFSDLKVKNFVDSLQSFSIFLKGGVLEFFDYKNAKITNAPQEKLRGYLGSIFGTYRAKEYLSELKLPENQKIYSLTVNGRKIDFYKKAGDFNLMYFSTEDGCGTATYFSFERVLTDAEKLK